MADFSKQWCDIWDPEMPYDFDIDALASELDCEECFSLICEGFGFAWILKDKDSNILLGYEKYESDVFRKIDWKLYESVLQDEINQSEYNKK